MAARESITAAAWLGLAAWAGGGLTWPGLQQVVQNFDVSLEVHCVGEARARAAAAGPAGVLARWQQHGAEAHSQVLRGHAVVGVEGRDQAQVVQEERQRGLRKEGWEGMRGLKRLGMGKLRFKVSQLGDDRAKT